MGKVILAISIILTGLSSYGQTNRDVFKLSDYVLVRTDSSSRGLDRKWYVYKYDTARTMVEEFFFDGNILGRGFLYKGKLEGNETFDLKGRPMTSDSFHNGVSVSHKSFDTSDTGPKFFSNGKLRALKMVMWILY